tara:strand:+ start:80257 stop:81207 length:951 start_codon:yes stop_codon:yes gene_type:complete
MSVILLELFKRFLGDEHNHDEERGQVSFDCPACAEDKGLSEGDGKHKLAINYNMGIFKCWVCKFQNNMHGKLPKLIKMYGNKTILREYNVLKPEYHAIESDGIPTKVFIPKGYKKLATCSQYDYKYSEAYSYVKKRGITDEMIEYYEIGYTTDGDYRFRIIIPSHNEMGELNFFISRAWDKWMKPKYLNPIVEKQLIVFNEDKINWDATIYLVEGVFDHIVIPNSIPLLGKYMTSKLNQLLHSKARANIVILLDDDAYDDAIRLYKDLNIGNLYNRIRMCVVPYNYDPSLIYEKLGSGGIVKLLKSSKLLLESDIY